MDLVKHLILGCVLVVAGISLAWSAAHPARQLFLRHDDKSVLFVLWIFASALLAYGATLVIQGFMR